MIIEIDENDFNQVLKIVKLRNTTLYNQIKNIKPLPDLNPVDTLATARTIKTDRIKESIKATLRELIQSNIKPTKYKVHKRTNIAYITLNKYFNDILDEVQNER